MKLAYNNVAPTINASNEAKRAFALEIERAMCAQIGLGQDPTYRPQGHSYTRSGHVVGRHAHAPRVPVEPYFGAWDR